MSNRQLIVLDDLTGPDLDPSGLRTSPGFASGSPRTVALTRDTVVTVDDIIEFIGGRAALVRAWIRVNLCPLRHPTGRVVYLWGDVLDQMDRRRAA